MKKEVKYGYDEDDEFEITVTLLSDENNPLDRTSIYLSRGLAQKVATQMKYGTKGGLMITAEDEAVKIEGRPT